MTNKPTDPADADPTEQATPAGQVEELLETAEELGATTDPAETDIGEDQLEQR